jgi:hypothetical protein
MRHLLLWTLLFLMVASSCRKNDNSNFPVVQVDEYIYLNNPENLNLGFPGGWVYHQGGYKGLFIVRRFINFDLNDFAAFDRGCPEHFDESCGTLEVADDDIFAICPCGGEKYLLFDGSPGDGASLSMHQYGHSFNGNTVHVFD